MQRNFKFNKNKKGEWWLSLPDWKGDPKELQMIEGADLWLDLVADELDQVEIKMSDELFEEASFLTLLKIREKNLGGGGNYYLENYKDKKVKIKLWFCEVTRFVFNCIPQKIYFKKISL